MFELKTIEDIDDLIDITKSDSGVQGVDLKNAHIRLGQKLAEYIEVESKDMTIVAVMRGGIFFAEGIYDVLGKKGAKFDVVFPGVEKYERPQSKYILIVDSVINTGKTIDPLIDEDTYLACNVINEKAVNKYFDRLYAVRYLLWQIR